MTTGTGRVRGNSGVALVTALVVLAVCMMMGAAYVQFMQIERDATSGAINGARARAAAEAGVRAAIGTIEQALKEGGRVPAEHAPSVLTELVIPEYAPAEGGLAQQEGRRYKVTVSVSDEASRVNVNFAPAGVLASVLGLEPNRARDIRSALPRIAGDDSSFTQSNARWLTSVDELMTRGLLTADEFAKVDRSLLTVYTVTDPANPSAFVNLNTAPAPVLAAVLGVTPEVAQQMQDKEFAAAADVAAAAGKDVTAFNFAPPADAPGALPKELAFSSRVYRISSRGTVEVDGQAVIGGTTTVEAVVVFDDAGKAHIRYWSATPGDPEPATTPPAPAAPANPAQPV